MSGPDWCRWYPAKWLGGVLHLNNEQRGVYIQVINVLLDLGECPADPAYLGRLCNCNRQRAARVVQELVTRGKLYESDGKLHQNRAESERKVAVNFAKSGADLAAKRWKNSAIDDAAPQCQPQPYKKEEKKERTEAPSGADQPDLDALFYRRGKALLGQKAGGVLTNLRKAVGLGAALEVIDQAQRKDSPAEYVAGVIRAKGNGYARTSSAKPSIVEAGRRVAERARAMDCNRSDRFGAGATETGDEDS